MNQYGPSKAIVEDEDKIRPRLSVEIVAGAAHVTIERFIAGKVDRTLGLALRPDEALAIGNVMMRAGGSPVVPIQEIDTRDLKTLDDVKRAFDRS